MTTNPTSGAADLPEALRSIQRFEVVDCIDDKHVPAVIPKPHGPWVRYEDHVTALKAAQPVVTPQPGAAYAELPDSLICAVDQWFADNIKDSDGCTTQDVRELAEIFYGVTHEGGRESVDDALAIVKSLGPGIGGINDTYARQVLLAEEVERLRGQATNAKNTGELLMGLAVIRELTGTQQKGLEETIEAVRAAVNAQKHPPAPATQQAGVALSDDLRDRLVAISEAIADQDDRAAQAMLREILKAPQPSPAAQGDALPREDFAWLVVQEACETEPADEDDPECVRILRRDLKSSVLAAFLRLDAARAAQEGKSCPKE